MMRLLDHFRPRPDGRCAPAMTHEELAEWERSLDERLALRRAHREAERALRGRV